jgi:hypothetical protein
MTYRIRAHVALFAVAVALVMAGSASAQRFGAPRPVPPRPIELPTINPLPQLPSFGSPTYDFPSDSSGGLSSQGGAPATSYDGGNGISGGDGSYLPPPPQPTGADAWRQGFALVHDYSPGVLIGASSQLQLSLALESLSRPLDEAPALLLLLDPNGASIDIDRLSRAASPDADVERITDRERAEEEMRNAMGRLKNRVVLLIGHVSYSESEKVFELEDGAGYAMRISFSAINEAADANGVTLVYLGCHSATPETAGTFRYIDTREVAEAIPAALTASTTGDVLRAIGGVIGLGVNAYTFVDGGLRIEVLRTEETFWSSDEAPIQIRFPPPERARAFNIVLPGGCDAAEDFVECDNIKYSIDASQPSWFDQALPHWPWAVGGVALLFIIWPRRRYG